MSTWSNPLSQPCRTGQHGNCHHDQCGCSCHPTVKYVHCPLRDCGWRVVDRSHLGSVVVVAGQDADDYLMGRRMPRLETRDAAQLMQTELLEHLTLTHVEELQLMLAGASGGRGMPVVCSVTQHIDARQVQDAADLVVSVLVPQMRAQLARKLAREKLRPVDPWPAVQVRKFCWAASPSLGAFADDPNAPPGMRPVGEDERPDLWQLELRTDAVPDTRTVEL